ncbi:MAG: hypothetical protein QM582_14405 [Micropruina sp.]|uniref:hypothetical protein n=1 Tax=Micropruina sp. TaxID=2737536 RepID=UPI0039E22D4D
MAIALTSQFLSAPTSHAAQNPCGASGNYHDGYVSTPSTFNYGALARIEYNNPDLCGADDTSASVSMAWVMIDAESAIHPGDGNAYNWAQVGYYQAGSSSAWSSGAGIGTFAQWTKKCKASLTCGSAVPWVTVFDGKNPTGSWEYKVYRSNSNGHIYMKADTKNIDVSTFDPFGDWSSGWRVEYAAETFHKQSDVPGTTSDPTSVDNIKKADINSTWSFTSKSSLNIGITPGTRYHASTFSPSGGGFGFRVWTSPLS